MFKKTAPFKILIITSPKGIRDIQKKLLRENNIAVETASFASLCVILSDKGIEMMCKGESLDDYDFVWMQATGMSKDLAYMLSLYLDMKRIPHTSPETEITKLVDLFSLSLNQIPIPLTYYCSRKGLSVNLKKISKKLGYPFLLKTTVGLGGNGVHMINSSKEMLEKIETLPKHKKYICQKFIPNKFDYRVLVGNGVVLSGEKRIRQGDLFRNNAKLGATEVFLKLNEIPDEVKELSLRATAACNLKWSGVDIVTNEETGESYILEVNRRPGLTSKSPEIKAAITFLKAIKRDYAVN